MVQDKDAEKSKRVMQAMLQMDKIDIKTLKQAYELTDDLRIAPQSEKDYDHKTKQYN